MSTKKTSSIITNIRSPSAARRRAVVVAAVAVVGGGALVFASLGQAFAATARAAFPNASSTGVPSGATLQTVPGVVSSGSGWHWDATNQQLDVTGNNTVLSGLYVPGTVNVTASNVTIKDDHVVTGGSGLTYGISLRHTNAVTIENSTVNGVNATSGRVDTAITDCYGDSTGIVIQDNDISAFRSAVQVNSGLVTGNYIHDPGYIAGDHTNGVIGSGTAQLTITNNTILDSLSQTDAITIDDINGGLVANKTIENNQLGGGSYAIYGGTAFGATTSNVVIENNQFSQAYYPKSGQYGPVAYFASTGTGNVWSGNTWGSTGNTIPAP